MRHFYIKWVLSLSLLWCHSELVQAGWDNRLIDGVEVRAVENIVELDKKSFNASAGIFPFNSYYDAFLFGIDFTWGLGRWVSWRVGEFQYAYSVTSELTSQLAQNYSVQPTQVDLINFIVKSSILVHLVQGKFLLFNHWIHYFQASVFLGGGYISFSQSQGNPIALAGLKVQMHSSPLFHWYIEVVDHFSVKNFVQIVTFQLGTGISF